MFVEIAEAIASIQNLHTYIGLAAMFIGGLVGMAIGFKVEDLLNLRQRIGAHASYVNLGITLSGMVGGAATAVTTLNLPL